MFLLYQLVQDFDVFIDDLERILVKLMNSLIRLRSAVMEHVLFSYLRFSATTVSSNDSTYILHHDWSQDGVTKTKHVWLGRETFVQSRWLLGLEKIPLRSTRLAPSCQSKHFHGIFVEFHGIAGI